jgi:NADH:ubiquinone oxidoreductase subunit E
MRSVPRSVTICVGSSCHIKGSRELIRRFSELIREHGLGDEVALQGCFCMERCGEGMNWRIGEENISSASVEEAVATFRARVLGAPQP